MTPGISKAYAVLLNYVQSCRHPRHLVVADKLINQFKRVFGEYYGAAKYLTELQCAMQLRRIDIKCGMAITQ